MQTATQKSATNVAEFWPIEARSVMAILETSFPPLIERRAVARHRFHARATLSLLLEGDHTLTASIYARDVNPWALGFVCHEQLPTGIRGTIELPDPFGHPMKVECSIRRSREFLPGWFEGVVSFLPEQHVFCADNVRTSRF